MVTFSQYRAFATNLFFGSITFFSIVQGAKAGFRDSFKNSDIEILPEGEKKLNVIYKFFKGIALISGFFICKYFNLDKYKSLNIIGTLMGSMLIGSFFGRYITTPIANKISPVNPTFTIDEQDQQYKLKQNYWAKLIGRSSITTAGVALIADNYFNKS